MFLEQFPSERRQNGWVEVVCGSMFSGKTEELIRRMKRAQFANQKMLLFKPIIDDRYHTTNIVSHQGTSIQAIPVTDSSEILKSWTDQKVIAVDEAQFFDMGLVAVCNQLADKGVRVIIAGLDMDYLGAPFGPMPELLAIAEYVTKVHAICLSCGNLAHYPHRISNEEGQVVVGAIEKYQPLCRTCYTKKND
jgi:thymidine kinase